MTEEEKAVEATRVAAAEKEALEKASEGAKDTVDYKAELERISAEKLKAEEERENYRIGMLNAKDQLKKKGLKKEEKEEEFEEEDDDKTRIDRLVKAQVESQLSEFKQQLSLNSFDSIVSDYSNDPDEQALIRYHFENSVAQNGSVRERIENAKLIANKKLFEKERQEMTFALRAKAGVSRSSVGAGGNLDVEKVTKEIFSPETIADLKKRGLDPEKVKETYLRNKALKG